MRKANFDIEVVQNRRKKVAEKVGDAVLVLPSHPRYTKNADVHYHYRQDSSMFYLTGYEESECVFVLAPTWDDGVSHLFVQPKDPLKETWDGFLFGAVGAKAEFAMDQAYEITELEKKLIDMICKTQTVFYSFYKNPEFDRTMHRVLSSVRRRMGVVPAIYDADEIMGEFRLIKDDYDQKLIASACEISAEAHNAIIPAIKPGVTENELHHLFQYEIGKRGAQDEGYGGIFAGGSNATTLHYVFNDQVCNDGDMILIDAGAEVRYFTGDITRCFPINGKFSPVQKNFYLHVLNIQKQLIDKAVVGKTFEEIQHLSASLVVDALFDLGLLSGRKSDALEDKSYLKYYPHGVGHWLGMDVHDVGGRKHYRSHVARRFESGMCLTIEPGIYVPRDDESAPKEIRGIGVRIEDDILITDSGNTNLTIKAIKEVDEIESLMAQNT